MRAGIAAVALAAVFTAPAFAGPPPRVTAEAYLVQNGTTGEVLARYDDAQRLPIASITKLMTVLVALERTSPDDVVTVSAQASSVGGATARLRAGERLSVRELVRAALVASANDATNALAEHVGGGSVERFVALMNRRARTLGLTDTHFTRPDGLDAPGHYSSARDVTKLARVAMRKTLVRDAVDDRSVALGSRALHGWNDLLAASTRYPVVGVKTGHTSDAGWCQVGVAIGQGGHKIYATLLGSPSRGMRNADLQSLLEWGAQQYVRRPVITTRRTYATAKTQYGRGDLRLHATAGATALLNRGHALREEVVAPIVVALPVRKRQRLGEVRVYDGEKLVARRPLVALQAVEKPDTLGRARWYAGRAADRFAGIFS